MKRLIDADALIDRLKKAYKENETYSVANGLAMAYDMVQGQPTIEAIPIEWIKSWMDKQYSWNLDGVVSLLRDWTERKEE